MEHIKIVSNLQNVSLFPIADQRREQEKEQSWIVLKREKSISKLRKKHTKEDKIIKSKATLN